MKITDLAMVFVIIAAVFVVRHYVESEAVEKKVYNELLLNSVVDVAVVDGVEDMVMEGNYGGILIDKQKAVDSFFETLYMNFGVFGLENGQRQIDLYVPVIVIVDNDGFYTYTMETFYGPKGKETIHVWSEKMPYTWIEDEMIYQASIGDFITLYDTNQQIEITGTFSELSRQGLIAYANEEAYNKTKNQRIGLQIEEAIRASLSEHNLIAKRYGVTYDFCLPSVSDDLWNQCVEDISFLAFVQGIPVGVQDTYYNSFAFGGAMIKKRTPYYVEIGIDGRLYWHTHDCDLLTDYTRPVNSREEAVQLGAWPCEKCGH